MTSGTPAGRAGGHHLNLPVGTVHYRAWGLGERDRPPVVLLHANAGSASSWSRVGPALGAHYPVYAPDLRGHGASVRPPVGRYGLRAAADDVAAFIATLALDRPAVIGHSWGAAIALVLASGAEDTHPAPALSKLVLVDPPAAMSMNTQGRQLENLLSAIELPAQVLRELAVTVNPEWHPDDIDSLVEGLGQANLAVVRSVVADGERSGSLLPLLARLSTRTLLIRADARRGSAMTNADWDQARRLLPAGCEARELSGAGHHVHRCQFEIFLHQLRSVIPLPALAQL